MPRANGSSAKWSKDPSAPGGITGEHLGQLIQRGGRTDGPGSGQRRALIPAPRGFRQRVPEPAPAPPERAAPGPAASENTAEGHSWRRARPLSAIC